MSVDYCPICREMVWNCGPHRCPPRWDTAIPDEDEDIDDGHVIRARTAEDAARRRVSKDDEYYDYIGTDTTVLVRDRDGVITTWVVTGDPLVDWNASEVKP